MIYSIPYILITVIFGVIAMLYSSLPPENETAKKNMDIVCIALFILFFGLRGYVGDDWMNYTKFYQDCSFDNISFNILKMGSESNYEPGYTILNLICKAITDEYVFFQLVCCCINVFLLYIFLKRNVSNVPLGFMLYVCMGGFLMSINLMRNTFAILIFANAVQFIEKRKPVEYFSLCLLALSFHLSSLMYFPLYFFMHKKCNKWVFLAIFALGNLLFVSHAKVVTALLSGVGSIVSDKMSSVVELYTEEYDTSKGLSIGYLERLITGTLMICYYDKLTGLKKSNIIFMNMGLIYFSIAFLFSEFDVMSQRLSTLFTIFYWVIWSDLLSCYAYDNNKRLFISFMAIYSVLKVAGLSHFITYDYDNFLFGHKSYNERMYIHSDYKYDDN